MNAVSAIGAVLRWPAGAREVEPVRTPDRAQAGVALFVTGFVTFLNLYAPQPMLPRFREWFHASEFEVSLTVSVSVLAVALAAPLIGLVADSVGRKRVIVAAMFGLAIPAALGATAANLEQLIFWRFLQGIAIPGIIAVAMAYISEESAPGKTGSTMATYVTGTVVGGFAGRFTAGLIGAHWGWRAAFVVLGVATLIGALLTWWLLPRSTRFQRHANAAASRAALRSHLRNPGLLATYAVGFNVLFCLVGAFTYVNFYLADAPFGLGPASLASVFGVYLVGAAITPLAGRLLDRIGYRRTLMAAAALAAAGILITLIRSLPVVIVGLALAATGAFVCQAAASSHVGKVARHARSAAAGLYVGFYYLGGCFGSTVPGLFWKSMGWLGCVAAMVCLQAMTLLVAKRLWKD